MNMWKKLGIIVAAIATTFTILDYILKWEILNSLSSFIRIPLHYLELYPFQAFILLWLLFITWLAGGGRKIISEGDFFTIGPRHNRRCKVVFTVPLENADAVRESVGRVGGGVLGKYSFCSFSSEGTGRFLPLHDARPYIGQQGKLEVVKEERVEITCSAMILDEVVKAIKAVHPYEEVALDIYELTN